MLRSLFLLIVTTALMRATPEGLSTLVPKLGDDNFEIREEASARLKKLVANEARREESLTQIRTLWLSESHPEIRARLFAIGQELFTQKKGALFGFRFLEAPPIFVEGERTTTISIIEVVPDSPAERAGLRPNDLVFGAGQELLGMDKSLDDILVFFKFLNPNEIHDLLVRRGNEDLTIKIRPETQEFTASDLLVLRKSFLQWLLKPEAQPPLPPAKAPPPK